jgi:3-oxoacyl-[acyl-carrier protein] reductase
LAWSKRQKKEGIKLMEFSGRVAIITGAGSPLGIGFATARLLAQYGAKIAITSTTDRIHERARELAADQADVFALPADLRDHASTHKLVREILARYGRIDALVNNAGMTQVSNPDETLATSFAELSEADWDYSIGLNLKTTFNVTKAVLPSMLNAKYGRIVNVSSVTGPLVSNPRATAYSAAKAGMVGLTRSLAMEVARSGITVNAVAPGWIETASSTEQEIIAGKNTPVGRPGRPEEVAAAIAFLACESASYVTGQMIVIDGGNTIQEYKGPPASYY